MIMVAHKSASKMGCKVPAANGATVRGMRPAEINLICESAIDRMEILVRTFQMSSDNYHELERMVGQAQGH